MKCKKESCLMVNQQNGNVRLVNPSEDPEQIVKGFLKWAKEPDSLIWAIDELVKQDWQKWEPARKGLWTMLEELDKLGY